MQNLHPILCPTSRARENWERDGTVQKTLMVCGWQESGLYTGPNKGCKLLIGVRSPVCHLPNFHISWRADRAVNSNLSRLHCCSIHDLLCMLTSQRRLPRKRRERRRRKQVCADRQQEKPLGETEAREQKHRVASGSWRATRQDRDGEESGKPHGCSLSRPRTERGL